MAGQGSRFLNAGYDIPKPLIKINGITMIETVYNNINLDGNYIFVVRQSDIINHSIDKVIKEFCPDAIVISQYTKLDGPVLTSLLAERYIDNEDNLMIVNCDQYLEWDSKLFFKRYSEDYDGSLLTFNSNNPKYSYIKTDRNSNIISVVEKDVISEHATCGIHFWRKGSDYVKYAKQIIKKDLRVNKEFYISTVYNEAIKNGKWIKNFKCNKMWDLGTPEDLNVFLEAHNE
jgi:dTDP-glucose pyrophosphorylase